MSVHSSELGPHPLPQASVSLPRNQRGETHSPSVEGVGVFQSDDWRKSLALCLLCGRELRIADIIGTKIRHDILAKGIKDNGKPEKKVFKSGTNPIVKCCAVCMSQNFFSKYGSAPNVPFLFVISIGFNIMDASGNPTKASRVQCIVVYASEPYIHT